MLRPVATLLLVSSVCLAQPANERLASAIKLWNHLKYFHPRVTASDVDWDAALTKAVPRVAGAKDEAEFAAAVSEMLAALKDPATHVNDTPDGPARNRMSVRAPVDGVAVVTFEAGSLREALLERRSTLPPGLAQAEAAVFDLRGVESTPLLPQLPSARACAGPSYASREHAGYANGADGGGAGSKGYSSSWKIQDGEFFPLSSKALRTVFLIDEKSRLPDAALAAQACGLGAIVSEVPVTDEVAATSRLVPGLGNLRVSARIYEVVYPDGTTGFRPNVVLNQTGDAALNAAIAFARAGNWPAVSGRERRTLPRAELLEGNNIVNPYPSMEQRVLAAARIWGILKYFHPSPPSDWDEVLFDSLPAMQRAASAREYHLAVARMVARVRDAHAWVMSSELNQLFGSRAAGLVLKWVDGQPVAVKVGDPALKDLIRVGDAITRIDGEPVRKRIDELKPYVPAGTPQSMMQMVMLCLLRSGSDSTAKVTVATASGEKEVLVPRNNANWALLNPRRSGDVIRLISPELGYVDLERLPLLQVDAMFEKFKDTTAIILDMRGYPSGILSDISARLADGKGKTGAVFRRVITTADAGGSIGRRYGRPESLPRYLFEFEYTIASTDKPRYTGKTVMLIDEWTYSAGEYLGLLLKAANSTVFIGSPTAGTGGDIAEFIAPGGLRIRFSGQEFRGHDGRQVQRVGLIPDIPVAPTIDGIRAGRDEVLERAIEYLKSGR